jgi:poly(3-hydroxyalkanoate) depolymerase
MNADEARAVRLVSVGGQLLRIHVRPGDTGRTPLLLVNGIGAAFESFDPLLDALDPARPVIRFDPPGAGGSPVPTRPYRLPGLARTMLALLDVLGHNQVDVLGVSWGGALAQQFAWTARNRCRRVVLVATGTGSLMVPARPRVLARMATPRRYTDPDFLRRVAPEIYGGTARHDPETPARLLHTHSRAGSHRGYAFQLLAAAGWTSVGFLPLLRQPTLVLTGDDDPLIPTVNGRLLTALIPHARLHVYPGGHLELIARPERLAPLIEEFLNSDT